MVVVWLIAVPVLLFLVWAVDKDMKHRRTGPALTDHSVQRAARNARNEAQAKGTEWGAGL